MHEKTMREEEKCLQEYTTTLGVRTTRCKPLKELCIVLTVSLPALNIIIGFLGYGNHQNKDQWSNIGEEISYYE